MLSRRPFLSAPRALSQAAAVATALFLFSSAGADAAATACKPCAGISVDDPFAIAPELGAAPRLDDDALLVIAWDVALDGAATPAGAHAIAATGATPLLRLRFTTPSPLLEHTDSLQRELEAAAELARLAPATTRFEIVWSGAPGAPAAPPAKEYGYLFKRAAVAIGGANSGAGIYPQPLVSDSSWLEAWYAEEVAAYLDGVTLAPADPATLADVLAFVSTLDPGRPIVVDGEPWPGDSRRALVAAARSAAAGADLTIFAEPAAAADGSTTALGSLAPLKILANEFQGDLSLDPYSRPTGAAEAWSFVRGEDLALRVIAAPAAGENELSLTFADTQLKSPAAVNLTNGEIVSLGGSRPTGQPMQLALRKTGPAVLLQIERVAADELDGGVAEKLLVASERQIPVEEILARLQSSEDRQARRLRHYQAVNRTSLRFQAASGVQTLEASFEGAFFSRQGEEPDWAWQTFFINGIRWRGKEIPEIPLIQPEKAASMPLEILFTKEYRYSLRGTEVVEGRDCWVVDFAPSVPVEGRALYRGTVWIDRELFVRVRSRAAQLGLTGEILSNEETIDYSPIDEAGAASAWNLESYYLPLRVRAQQILSVLNTATVIEKEVVLTDVILNGPDFDRQREDLLASDATMVRDTAQGLRYLVKDEAGGRVVKEGFDTSKLFLLGGAFYDDSLDYPLPLVGLNYFDINFRGGDRQLNAFFGGVLGIVNFADPRIGESKFDLGTDLFAFAISTSDQLYRNEVESVDEEIENRPARVNINAGHPLGSYGKITATYQLAYDHYGRSDNTAPDFVLPESGLTHRLGLQYAFARSGYRLALEGSYHQRQNWSFWGLPGNTDFDPDQKEYSTWQVSLSKSWYLAKFRKFGVELNYSGGRNLDRFSKYQFGIFGGNRVHGYQIGKVRAEELYAAHLSYGFELGELLRIDGLLDAAWATDETSGLDNELLSGVGISGTFLGPWNTLVNLDVGTPIAGPDDGISVYLVFLKLFQ